MAIYSYIAKNINDINQFSQDDKNWRTMHEGIGVKEVDAALANCHWFRQIMKGMPDKLSREMVADFYKQDLYKGFVATLLWGGAHCNHVDCFRSIVYYPNTTIIPILNNVYNSLQSKGMSAELFNSLCRGGVNHIHGLGPSFFTKVFYFMSLTLGWYDILILDIKMWKVYNDFRIENNLIPRKISNYNFLDYKKYLNYMCNLPGVNRPDQLEAFLFEKY